MRSSAMHLTSRFRWKLAPALLVVSVGDWLFYQSHFYGGYLGLFAFTVMAALMMGRPQLRHDRRSWIALAMATMFALALVYDASLLAWILFWVAAGVAILLPATARFDDGWRWFQRLTLHGLRAPFAPLIDLRRLLKLRAAGRVGRFSLHAAVGTLALPLLGSVVILTLFAVANPVIERFLSTSLFPELSISLFMRIAFWAVLFATIWSLLRPRLALRLLPIIGEKGHLPLPGVSIASVTLSLLTFNLIFAVQNAMDAAWLWGWAPMPEGMTLAAYAHRGAYPLIATALLAALFVLVTLRPGSDTARTVIIRQLVLLWIGQNIILVASSMLRTLDYIDAYSLTRLRIAALIWMALVGFGLAVICWRVFRGRSASWLINVNLAATGLVLCVVSFVDLGAVAAQWNVRHAREVGGKGQMLDLCYLSNLGDSALLPILELDRRADLHSDFRARARSVGTRLFHELDADQRNGWTLLGQRRLDRARLVIAKRPAHPIPSGERGCDGALVPQPESAPRGNSTFNPALTGATGK